MPVKVDVCEFFNAARLGSSNQVLLYLQQGGDIEVIVDWGSTRVGFTALGIAAYWGTHDIVSLLLDRGADINAAGGTYGTALSAAAFGGQSDIVSLLLDRGADINAVGGKYGTALSAAAVARESDIVSLLLDRGADIKTVGGKYGTALSAAASRGYEEIVFFLLGGGADINAVGGDYGSALSAAAFYGEEETVSLLLEQGADINAVGGKYGTALSTAVYGRQLDIMSLLLDRGADINAVGGEYGTTLSAAVSEGYKEVVSLLLDRGPDINAVGGWYGTALYVAASKGSKKIVSLLLDQGADINAVGGEYGTALSAAVSKGYKEIVSLLLGQGADINAVGGEYGTALSIAAYLGNDELVSLLLDRGADIDLAWGKYGTALSAAMCAAIPDAKVSSRKTYIVSLLLERGADVNAVSGKYGSVLGIAAYRRDMTTVSLLLKNGANATFVGGIYKLKTSSGISSNALDAAGYESTQGSKADGPLFALLEDAVIKQTSNFGLSIDSVTNDPDELIARPPFPMPYSNSFPPPSAHQNPHGISSKRANAIRAISSSNSFFRIGDNINPEYADILCGELKHGVLLRLLVTLVGLDDDTTERLQGWIQNDIRYFVARSFDLGVAYAAARVAWKNFNEHDDNRISVQRGRWYWHAKQLENTRADAIYSQEDSKQELINSPYSIMPRRVWDLKSNRVVNFQMIHSANLSMAATTKPDLKSGLPSYWAVSHSWTEDVRPVETSINQSQWPVPLPQGTDVNYRLRSELLSYGAEYVWLDVLCLRQHSDNASDLLKQQEWKLDVPTIGNIYRAADRIIRYFNGVGREFSHGGWDDDRHWLNRAWTLQEIQTEHTTINGGVPRDKGYVLMNTRGKVKKIDAGKEVEIETTLRRAIRPVLRLASEVDSINGCGMYDLAKEMAKRKASTPLDRVSGLFYLLRITKLPCYQEGVGPEDFWRECFHVLPAGRKLEILFEYPYRGSDEQWFPTWTQIMNWPEKDPDYDHVPIQSVDMNIIQDSGKDLSFHFWSISSVVLYRTVDSSEYEAQIGHDRRFGFYSPYQSQKPINTKLQNQKLKFTLVVSKPDGHSYNWLVCEAVGKQFISQGTKASEVIVLRKLGVLRTDSLAEFLVGGKNGRSMLEEIDCLIV